MQAPCAFVPKLVMDIAAPGLSHAERTLSSWEKPSLQPPEAASPPLRSCCSGRTLLGKRFGLFSALSSYKILLPLLHPGPQQLYSDVSRDGFSVFNSAGSSLGFLNL